MEQKVNGSSDPTRLERSERIIEVLATTTTWRSSPPVCNSSPKLRSTQTGGWVPSSWPSTRLSASAS